MDLTSQTIYDAALRLSEEDRLELAVHLLDSLPEDAGMLSFDDPNLLAELERRGTDEEGAMTWEELRDELRPGPPIPPRIHS